MNPARADLLGKTNIKKALITLTIPAMIGMMLNAAYNLVDSLFVGWAAGEVAIGALTLAYPIQMISIAIALMLGIGGASVFSRAFGRGDYETMNFTVNTAVRAGIISGLSILIFGTIFLDDILTMLGATASNIGFAHDYLSVVLFGLTFQTMSMILNNLTRAEGRAIVAMVSIGLGATLNIILDPIFIFDWGLGLGVKGAAYATVISQFVAFSYVGIMAFHEKSVLRINLKKFNDFNTKTLKEIVSIGIPTFVRNAIASILAIVILRIIDNSISNSEVQALYISIYGVMNRVIIFVLLPGFGLVQGFAPLAGYNFGAKNWERLNELIFFAIKIMVGYFILGFIFIQLGAPLIFDVFSSNNDAFFIETGALIFRTISIGFIFIAPQVIAGATYQAFGYPYRALFISLTRQFIFFIPFAFILSKIFGLDGLWYTFFVADILAGTTSIFFLRHELKDLKKRKAMANVV